MLIAIMGDTFDRVKEDQGRRDFQELARLVYRYEIVSARLCKRRKKKKGWKYVYYSREMKEEGEEGVETWEGRIRGIKREFTRIQTRNEEWQSRIEQELRLSKEQHLKTQSRL